MSTQGASLRSPASQPAQPMLRLGLVVHGRLIQERLVPLGHPVTLGAGAGCTLSVPDHALPEGAPESLLLVSAAGAVPMLVVSAELRGALDQQGQRTQLDGLGGAAPAMLPLEAGVRGAVRFGHCTVLLQIVQSAPPPALTLRRGAFRPRLFDPDDPLFLGMLGVWSTVAAGLMGWVFSVGPVDSVSIAELPQEMQRLVYLSAPAPEAPEVELVAPDAPPVPTAPPSTEATRPEAPEEPEPARELQEVADNDVEAQQNAALEREQAREAVLGQSALLTAISKGVAGSLFAKGSELEGIQGALDDLEGPAVASTQPAARGGTNRRGFEDGSIGGPERGATGPAEVVKVRAAAPKKPKMKATPQLPGSSAAPAGLSDQLRPHLARLRSCYEQELKRNPSVAGRVVLSLELVGGAVVDAQVVEDGVGVDTMAQCLERSAGRIRIDSAVEGELRLPLVFSAGS